MTPRPRRNLKVRHGPLLILLASSSIKKTKEDHESMAIVGLIFGPRPPLEAWQWAHWVPLVGIEVSVTQGPSNAYRVQHLPPRDARNGSQDIGSLPLDVLKQDFHPRWQTQVLLEIDLKKVLQEKVTFIEMMVFTSTKRWLVSTSNACFHCGAQGHLIKECPKKQSNKASP